MITILVTGANGQLGNEIKSIYKKDIIDFKTPIKFIFTDIDTLDISNKISLKKIFQDQTIDYIINCAAYTNVDLAETEKDKAFNINATCVEHIVNSIRETNTKLIHISTDYVFDGNSYIPYKENMSTNPQSVYGSSKLKGEEYALSYKNSICIRTSWLYSSFGKNFAKTIYKLCKEKENLNVVFDQIGTPTYAYDLAQTILTIIKQSISENLFVPGIYHYSNEGVCSWFDFAKAIASKTNTTCIINPIESKDFPTPAKRPFYSVLNKEKIKSIYKINIPHWYDSLNAFFKAIQAQL